MNKNELEKKIPYLVKLKESFPIKDTVINQFFCGFLVNSTQRNFYFELKGSRMLVIVPHKDIEYMAPSRPNFLYIRLEEGGN